MRGLFVGRFQPFHLGHLQLLKTVLEIPALHEMIIAIANVEGERTKTNPFSFAERALMIRLSLPDLIQTNAKVISVVPLPYVSPPDRFAPSIFEQFGPIDLLVSNNDWVRAQFQNLPNIRLHPKFYFHRDQYRGGKIRDHIANGDDSWKSAVTDPVAQYISNQGKEIFAQFERSQQHPTKQDLVNSTISYPFFGEVFSGMRVAARYVETPHFFQALSMFLGATPLFGTLNIRLQYGASMFFKYLRSREALRIPPLYECNVSFWSVDCYPAILQISRHNRIKCFILALDFGIHKSDENVVELIAHPHLRNMLDLKDGDIVTIRIL